MSEKFVDVPGGWSSPRPLDVRDLEIFNRAMEHGPVGVSFRPFEVATQVVAGLNYRFTCNVVVISPLPEPLQIGGFDKAKITIFEALPCYGGNVEIKNIEFLN